MYKKRAILLFIIGFLIFIFPIVSNFIYERQCKSYAENFHQTIDKKLEQEIPSKDSVTTMSDLLYDEFKKYNENIYKKGQMNLLDPFSFEVASFDLKKYGFEENVAGDIYIERLNLTLPIYLGSTKENMSKGATLLGCTSMPIGGENTNTVIAAHRGYSTKEMFRNINKIQIGDEIIIHNFWGELKYKVIETKVIYPDEIENILIQDGKDLLTLTSCHPYGFNYQRYIVIAERVY